MPYYIAVYCFENTSFLSFDCRETLYLTAPLEGCLPINKSQLFVLVESVRILGQELSKVEEKGNKEARTNSNKQCWGRKVENRGRFACIEVGDFQGGCGLEQKQVSDKCGYETRVGYFGSLVKFNQVFKTVGPQFWTSGMRSQKFLSVFGKILVETKTFFKEG